MINLYKHQIDVLKKTEKFNKCAYYLDMGLGKTFIGSEKANSFNDKILVICQKSKINDWIEHYQMYYDYAVFDLTKSKQLVEYIDCIGKCVGIINYDLCWRRKDLLMFENFTLMLDESSLISNERAKRSKFILKLHAKNVILLSGTPVSGKYEQLWSQCKLLGWNITKRNFWSNYIITKPIDIGGFNIDIVVGYKHVDHLKKSLAEYGTVFMKTEEVLTLPDQIEQKLFVDQSKEYKYFKKNHYIKINNEELVGDNSLTQIMYERQLCGQYSKDKINAVKDLIDSTSDRLIIFYNFNKELNILKDICKSRLISEINGRIRDLSAYENEKDSITLVQYQAGAMGLNLQKANKIIYFTLPLGKGSCDLWQQSKKRIHRIGQNQPCFYYYPLVKNSIEEWNLKLLQTGKELTDKLFLQNT